MENAQEQIPAEEALANNPLMDETTKERIESGEVCIDGGREVNPPIEIPAFDPIKDTKNIKLTIMGVVDYLRDSERQTAERTLAMRKCQEAVAWLVEDLKKLN